MENAQSKKNAKKVGRVNEVWRESLNNVDFRSNVEAFKAFYFDDQTSRASRRGEEGQIVG